MKPSLCISFRFIRPDPLFHGRGDADEAEWPPSPMRAFQALLNAACLRVRGKPLSPEVRSALQVIEVLRPSIVAPRVTLTSTGHRTYVPHNQTDLVTAAWDRGNNEASIASHRIEKDFRPHRLHAVGEDLPTLHYLYPLDATTADPDELLNAIRPSVRSVYSLGWGIDQVVADATLVDPSLKHPVGESWKLSARGGNRLRVHRSGSLDALAARHDKFLNRLVRGDWTPVPPLSAVVQVRYRRDTDPAPRPFAVFKLLDANDDTYRHPHSKLIHIAGMVRHLAIDAMTRNPPASVKDPATWVERYVAGHQLPADNAVDLPHAQLSYIPLPSIGHHHTDPSVRRVMIVAPVGDDVVLEHLCRHLDGLRLKPERETDLSRPAFLHRSRNDNVASFYTDPAINWASVTPVILPGHDDHKPDKTRRLIEKALSQSGVDRPCTFQWSAYSHFPKSFSAHKYDKAKKPIGYLRPDHLQNLTAVHLTLTYDHEIRVPGPLAIGAGRHCGFGLMAAVGS